MPSTPGSSVTGGGALGEEGSLYSLYCLEKLSEKSRMRLKRSLTGHRNGASWPILASVYRPNPRQERPLHPFRTVSRREILGNWASGVTNSRNSVRWRCRRVRLVASCLGWKGFSPPRKREQGGNPCR